MVLEIGVIAAFSAMLCWGIGDFLIQRNARHEGNVEALFFMGIISILGLSPFVLNDLPMLFEPQNLTLLGFLGLLTFVVAMFELQALKKGKLTVIETLLELELPITIGLAFFFFDEAPTLVQMSIISLVFLGIVLVSLKSHRIKDMRRFLEKGVIVGIIGAVFMGAMNFFTGTSARQISPFMAIWMPAVVFTIVCAFIIWKREGFSRLASNFRGYKYMIIAMGIFDTAAWTSYAVATSVHEMGVITAITESYVAVAVVLGILLNKEKILHHQYLGASLAIVSSFILALML